jgi:hypothetical protein
MLPLNEGKVPQVIFHAEADEATELEVELRISGKSANYTPDVILEKQTLAIQPGRNCLHVDFSAQLTETAYAFIVFHKNPKVKLHLSQQRVTGVISVFNSVNKAVSNFGKQVPTEDIGVDEFEFWCPQRRPEGHNVAFKLNPSLNKFGKENIKSGVYRPVNEPNAWVAAKEDKAPSLQIAWDEVQTIQKIELFFDTDYDHPMESVLMGHPEDVMPFCVRNYTIKDDLDNVVFEKSGNYQTINTIVLDKAISTKHLTITLDHPSENVPAALFGVRCY